MKRLKKVFVPDASAGDASVGGVAPSGGSACSAIRGNSIGATVLGVSKQKTGRGLPPFSRYTFDGVDFERMQSAPSVQLISRDAFVIDMAIKLDQVQLEIRALSREFDAAKKSIAEIREDTDRNYRFASFQDNEQRTRSHKLDEMCRRFKHLKERIDAIDGKRKGDFQYFESLDSISKRLTELGSLERKFKDVERKLKYCAGLFCGSVLMWLVTFLSSG